MLSFSGATTRLCQGLTRREALRIGGIGPLGLSLAQFLAAKSSRADTPLRGNGFGHAKACILLWMTGGPPQHETWDPKPEAPAEIRGAFQPIATNVPGTQVCELMPLTAQRADQLCILRGLHTDNPSHPGSSYEMFTGVLHPLGKGRDDVVASRHDAPSIPAIVNHLKPPHSGLPTSVVFPQPIFNVPFYPGQDAGFLGSERDPLRLTCDPAVENFRIDELAAPAEVSVSRLTARRELLDGVHRSFDQLERGSALVRFDGQVRQAFDLVAGERARVAFDLGREPTALRERYGRHTFGQGCLLARRLIEAGVTFVQLNWHREQGDDTPMWDAHWKIEQNLKQKLMPPMDQGYSALLDDMQDRGLLDETLVVWMGEFGRTPKLEFVSPHPTVGRNHWGNVFSGALAGAGVRAGQVYGASDRQGAFPQSGAAGPADFTATIYHALGLDIDTEIRDRLHRPHPVSRGRPMDVF